MDEHELRERLERIESLLELIAAKQVPGFQTWDGLDKSRDWKDEAQSVQVNIDRLGPSGGREDGKPGEPIDIDLRQ